MSWVVRMQAIRADTRWLGGSVSVVDGWGENERAQKGSKALIVLGRLICNEAKLGKKEVYCKCTVAQLYT